MYVGCVRRRLVGGGQIEAPQQADLPPRQVVRRTLPELLQVREREDGMRENLYRVTFIGLVAGIALIVGVDIIRYLR